MKRWIIAVPVSLAAAASARWASQHRPEIAAAVRRTADLISPEPPRLGVVHVEAQTVHVDGVPLARITAGMIVTDRSTRH